MEEKTVERKLKRGIEGSIPGSKCLKFVSPGFSGVPDRIVLIPGGVVVFVETKRPGEKPRRRQLFVHALLRKMGFRVYGCVDTPDKVRKVVTACIRIAAYMRSIGSLIPADEEAATQAGEWADQPVLGPGA